LIKDKSIKNADKNFARFYLQEVFYCTANKVNCDATTIIKSIGKCNNSNALPQTIVIEQQNFGLVDFKSAEGLFQICLLDFFVTLSKVLSKGSSLPYNLYMWWIALTLIRMAIKSAKPCGWESYKCESKATNRQLRGLPMRAPSPCRSYWLPGSHV
jgi:hypothetical protein